MKTYTIQDLAKMIDHTNLHADASFEDLTKLCNEAVEYGFASVCVNSAHAGFVAQQLSGTSIAPCVTIGFPLGAQSIAVKLAETCDALDQGARELDYVINITEIKAQNWEHISREMQTLVDVCHERSALVKVIFENCYLTKEEKLLLCEIANSCDIDFIKTSTGFGTGGATKEDVALMRTHAKESIRVKAAGGIRTADDMLDFVRLGAERIGCSAGIPIIEELEVRGVISLEL